MPLTMETENITYLDLGIAMMLPLLVIAIIYIQKLKIGGLYLYALCRATIQLTLIGYLLKFIFEMNNALAVLAYLFCIVGVAAFIVLRLQKKPPPTFYPVIGVAIFAGTIVSVVIVTRIVLTIEPWYNPRYLIPLAGMMIGNTMTASALSLERLRNDIRQSKNKIEAMIALGATQQQAVKSSINRSLKAGLMPNITSMLGIGLVHLPGMMTGQMIAGNVPTQAVRYQLLVIIMLSAAVAITAIITLKLSARRHFTTAHQLRKDLL